MKTIEDVVKAAITRFHKEFPDEELLALSEEGYDDLGEFNEYANDFRPPR